MKRRTSILSLLLALMMIVTLAAGCGSKTEEEPGAEGESSSSSEASVPKPTTSDKTVGESLPDMLEIIEDMYEENDHTVGWLYVPGTEVDDVVVQHPEVWNYYERRNFAREYEFNGIYFAELDCEFGDGDADDLSLNTIIYGHALTDDEEKETYPIMFGSLHNFRDEEQAKKMPYIYFSTLKENLAYEVFAVFMVNADNPDFRYNRLYHVGDKDLFTEEEYYKMVTEEVLPRSIYNYNVELTPEDRYITLSTCLYNRLDEGVTNYPNTYMRYVIMGKLVDTDEPLKLEADFTVNEDAQYDADGAIASA